MPSSTTAPVKVHCGKKIASKDLLKIIGGEWLARAMSLPNMLPISGTLPMPLQIDDLLFCSGAAKIEEAFFRAVMITAQTKNPSQENFSREYLVGLVSEFVERVSDAREYVKIQYEILKDKLVSIVEKNVKGGVVVAIPNLLFNMTSYPGRDMVFGFVNDLKETELKHTLHIASQNSYYVVTVKQGNEEVKHRFTSSEFQTAQSVLAHSEFFRHLTTHISIENAIKRIGDFPFRPSVFQFVCYSDMSGLALLRGSMEADVIQRVADRKRKRPDDDDQGRALTVAALKAALEKLGAKIAEDEAA